MKNEGNELIEEKMNDEEHNDFLETLNKEFDLNKTEDISETWNEEVFHEEYEDFLDITEKEVDFNRVDRDMSRFTCEDAPEEE